MRVGILGGAFNPPHLGHLVCAQEALLQLELDTVVFVPTGQPPHRVLEDDPGGDLRLEMVELAIAGDSRFAASRIELDRPGPSYTAETLAAMRSAEPDHELFLIVGGDQAASLPDWHEPEQVLAQATLVVVERVSRSRSAIGLQLAPLRGADTVLYLETPLIQVSSTMLRRRVAGGEPIRYLVPERVVSLIGARGLYASSEADGAAPRAAPDAEVAGAATGGPEAAA